jgi:hypothetical protein
VTILGALPVWKGSLPPVQTWPDGAPQAYTVGLMARDSGSARTPAVLSKIRSYVVEVDWADAQPAQGGPISAATISQLSSEAAYASTNGLRIRVRIFAGIKAPEWAKTVGGFTPLPWNVKNQNTGVVGSAGTVGPWWRSDYIALFDDFLTKFAAALAPHVPTICEVTQSGLMTLYAEPLIHQWEYQDPNTIIAAGYTVDLEFAAFKEANQAYADAMCPIGVATSLAVNPFQKFDPSKANHYTPSVDLTLWMIDLFCSQLGRFAVLENNSLVDPIGKRGPRYQTIYEYMVARRARTVPFPVGLSFQTAALPRMQNQLLGSTPYGTAAMAASWKALSVEMPGGWTNPSTASDGSIIPAVTQEQADALNAQFAVNYADLEN